ncbi:MAG TPA: aquaporin [Microbacteriaceae bacterium]
MTFAQREEIAIRRVQGQSLRQIGAAIGRSPSTISRELRRNRVAGAGYRATTVHALAFERASRPKPAKLHTNMQLRVKVENDLVKKYSPEQIAGRLRVEFQYDGGGLAKGGTVNWVELQAGTDGQDHLIIAEEGPFEAGRMSWSRGRDGRFLLRLWVCDEVTVAHWIVTEGELPADLEPHRQRRALLIEQRPRRHRDALATAAALVPAVSIAFALRGDFPWARVPRYIFAQLIGASLAAWFLTGVLPVSASIGSNYPAKGYSDGIALVMEMVLTFGLVSVILGTASGAQNVGIVGAFGVGAYIALAALWGSPISGASMNPARTFGPDLLSGDFTAYWVYVVGPISGAVVAVGAAYVLRGHGGGLSGSGAAQGGLNTVASSPDQS